MTALGHKPTFSRAPVLSVLAVQPDMELLNAGARHPIAQPLPDPA